MANENYEELITHVIHTTNELETQRKFNLEELKDIRKWIFPSAASHEVAPDAQNSQALQRGKYIFDDTAQDAHKKLAGSLMSGLTNMNQEWFTYYVGDKKKMKSNAVKTHMEKRTEQVLDLLLDEDVNFYGSAHENYVEITGNGTMIGYAEFDTTAKEVFCDSLPLAHCFFLENKNGMVDTVYRPMWFTAKQILEKFGDDLKDQPEAIKNLEDQDRMDPVFKFKVMHAVFPRAIRKFDSLAKTNKKFASVYVAWDPIASEGSDTKRMLLRNSGMDRLPYYVARWEKENGVNVLGRGPAHNALTASKVLNKMVKTNLESAEIMVRPPLQAAHQGFQRQLNLSRKAVNYFRAVPGLADPTARPINTVGQLPVALEMENNLRRMIEKYFFADVIAKDEKKAEMTALEASQREQADMRMMAPYGLRIMIEWLSRFLRDAYEYFEKIDPVEIGELKGVKVRVRFNSPMSRAMRTNEVAGFQAFTQNLLLYRELKPEIMDIINYDELPEFFRDMHNVATYLLKTPEQIKEINKQAQANQSEQQDLAKAEQASNVGLNIADIIEKTGGLV